MSSGLLLAAVLAAGSLNENSAPSVTDVQIQGPFELHAVLVKPAGSGPFRAIVYNHGSKRDAGYKDQVELGDWFRDHGYVVLFPFRRGVNGSEGPYLRDVVDKQPPRRRDAEIVRTLDRENDDVLSAVAWLRRLPFVDPNRVAVAGCSSGGIEALLTVARSKEIFAALDFAGASMQWARSAPLRARLEQALRDAQSPIFLLQAENDFDTTPTVHLSQFMQSLGKRGLGRIYPPHGKTAMDGHTGFCYRGMNQWGPDVLRFMDDAADPAALATHAISSGEPRPGATPAQRRLQRPPHDSE